MLNTVHQLLKSDGQILGNSVTFSYVSALQSLTQVSTPAAFINIVSQHSALLHFCINRMFT